MNRTNQIFLTLFLAAAVIGSSCAMEEEPAEELGDQSLLAQALKKKAQALKKKIASRTPSPEPKQATNENYLEKGQRFSGKTPFENEKQLIEEVRRKVNSHRSRPPE